MIKNTKKISLCILLATLSGTALSIDLPSDKDMIKKGKEMVHGLDPQHDKAKEIPSDSDLISTGKKMTEGLDVRTQKTTGTAQRAADPIDEKSMSPLARQLMKETLDFSEGKNLLKNASKKGDADLMLFVSFSMPEKLLTEYSRQAKEAGAVIVLRGLYENSITKTQQKAALLNPVIADWQVNPGAFKKYKVDKVPSLVITEATEIPLDEEGCAVPKMYLKVDGDLSIRQSLYTMNWRGEGPLAKLAGAKLKNLNSD